MTTVQHLEECQTQSMFKRLIKSGMNIEHLQRFCDYYHVLIQDYRGEVLITTNHHDYDIIMFIDLGKDLITSEHTFRYDAEAYIMEENTFLKVIKEVGRW